jgi:hypothetical protein
LWSGRWWLLVFCLPGVLVALHWGFGKLLLARAVVEFGRRGLVGVMVTSDSPNWNAYIRENWLERFGDRFVVLNWSQRKQWEGLAAGLFGYFVGRDENFCPAVILLRGLRRPLVFRCFYAFRDSKHGNESELRRIEERLAREMGLSDGADEGV